MSERIVETTSSDDGPSAAMGASALIQTIVWSIVVLVVLVVGIILLLHFHLI